MRFAVMHPSTSCTSSRSRRSTSSCWATTGSTGASSKAGCESEWERTPRRSCGSDPRRTRSCASFAGTGQAVGASDRQWRDVIGILNVQRGRLDLEVPNAVAGEVGLSDLLERALQEASRDG